MFKGTHHHWRMTFLTLSIWITYLESSKAGKIDLFQSTNLFSVSCVEIFSSAIRKLFYSQSRSHSSLKHIADHLIFTQWGKSLLFFPFLPLSFSVIAWILIVRSHLSWTWTWKCLISTAELCWLSWWKTTSIKAKGIFKAKLCFNTKAMQLKTRVPWVAVIVPTLKVTVMLTVHLEQCLPRLCLENFSYCYCFPSLFSYLTPFSSLLPSFPVFQFAISLSFGPPRSPPGLAVPLVYS